LLRRVATILNDHIDEITRDWAADLRQSPDTDVHAALLARQITDGLRVILTNVTSSIRTGVAPDAEGARAAAAAELASRRDRYPRLPIPDTALPPALALPPAGPPETARQTGGRQPAPRHRRLYRVRANTPPAADDLSALRGETLRRALAAAGQKGQLRQAQAYQVNEVVQEYVHLRRRIWRTLRDHMRRTDRPAVELAIYLDGLLYDLLIATVQAYQEAAVADLQKRVVRDPLTGLFNYDYFQARLQEEVYRARRDVSCVSLLMFDLDQLKHINDTYGHQVGDRALVHVAAAMRVAARESDVLCRYAGDEFACVLPRTHSGQARLVAERLRAALRRPLSVRSALDAGAVPPTDVVVTISGGIATYPDDARTAETLTAQADAALYRAKAAGRDRVL